MPDTCEEIDEDYLRDYSSFFILQTVCQDDSLCEVVGDERLSADDILCIEGADHWSNSSIYLSTADNEELWCNDMPNQDFGDYWCPKGFIYRYELGVCEFQTLVCDQGFSGELRFGCDTPLSPGDDYWKLYQEECVFRDDTPVGLYDSFCCLEATFNNYEIWQEKSDTNHVKVY